MALLTSWNHRFINAHIRPTQFYLNLSYFKTKRHISESYFRKKEIRSCGIWLSFCDFCGGTISRPDHSAEEWRAPLLGRSQETQGKPETTQLKHRNTENSGKHKKRGCKLGTTRNTKDRNDEKSWEETKLLRRDKNRAVEKKGEYWSEERGESRDVLKGCESVKEEERIGEEEEEEVVVKMMTNVGIYEFNAKDLIGHGAFAVVYKGRLKSVSCATLFQISAEYVYISLSRGKDLLICVFDFKPSQPFTLDLHSLTFSCSAIQQQLTLFSSAHWLLIITSRLGLGIIDYWSYSLEMMAQHPPPPLIAILVINILAFIVASAI